MMEYLAIFSCIVASSIVKPQVALHGKLAVFSCCSSTAEHFACLPILSGLAVNGSHLVSIEWLTSG